MIRKITCRKNGTAWRVEMFGERGIRIAIGTGPTKKSAYEDLWEDIEDSPINARLPGMEGW